jgi:CheY-like chemotaxis protein
MNQPFGPEDFQKTILIADDNPVILRFVSNLLVEKNYHVLLATSGQRALEQSRRYEREIHLLLSDFEMPGMNGIELATAISADRPDLKVLLMSGFDGGMLVLNEGWHYLPKPFIASQLLTLISGLISPHLRFREAAAAV